MMQRIRFRVWVLTRREKFQLVVFGFFTLLVSSRVFAAPQVVQERERPPRASSEIQPEAANTTPLNVLIDEARKNDPAIHVAESTARAASFAAQQMSSRADTQFTIQRLRVCSPR